MQLRLARPGSGAASSCRPRSGRTGTSRSRRSTLNETPSNSSEPAISLRRLVPMTTAMAAKLVGGVRRLACRSVLLRLLRDRVYEHVRGPDDDRGPRDRPEAADVEAGDEPRSQRDHPHVDQEQEEAERDDDQQAADDGQDRLDDEVDDAEDGRRDQEVGELVVADAVDPPAREPEREEVRAEAEDEPDRPVELVLAAAIRHSGARARRGAWPRPAMCSASMPAAASSSAGLPEPGIPSTASLTTVGFSSPRRTRRERPRRARPRASGPRR